jgi:hypothetical protein
MRRDCEHRTRGGVVGQKRVLQRLATVGVLLGAVIAALVAAFVIAPTAESRALACDPVARLPQGYDSSNIGWAEAESSTCGFYEFWSYTLKLVNRAGAALQTDTGTLQGYAYLYGTSTGCAGAYVHTFFYMNVSGAGKSDTSGESTFCLY